MAGDLIKMPNRPLDEDLQAITPSKKENTPILYDHSDITKSKSNIDIPGSPSYEKTIADKGLNEPTNPAMESLEHYSTIIDNGTNDNGIQNKTIDNDLIENNGTIVNTEKIPNVDTVPSSTNDNLEQDSIASITEATVNKQVPIDNPAAMDESINTKEDQMSQTEIDISAAINTDEDKTSSANIIPNKNNTIKPTTRPTKDPRFEFSAPKYTDFITDYNEPVSDIPAFEYEEDKKQIKTTTSNDNRIKDKDKHTPTVKSKRPLTCPIEFQFGKRADKKEPKAIVTNTKTSLFGKPSNTTKKPNGIKKPKEVIIKKTTKPTPFVFPSSSLPPRKRNEKPIDKGFKARVVPKNAPPLIKQSNYKRTIPVGPSLSCDKRMKTKGTSKNEYEARKEGKNNINNETQTDKVPEINKSQQIINGNNNNEKLVDSNINEDYNNTDMADNNRETIGQNIDKNTYTEN
eukprot:GHVP01011971.1.p1 GENE.GHVP01011971.1~~GHVP01011971.1.p1  ORF type:complete len:459 (+),score=88.91 GHVP01011971.1:770-2146(+)